MSGFDAQFPGAIPSSLDEPVDLPFEFAQMRDEVERIVAQRARGELDDGRAYALLEQVRVVRDEVEWTVGARTGQFYRRAADGQWEPSDPPREDPWDDDRIDRLWGE